MITSLRATRTASARTSVRWAGGTCSMTSDTTTASKLRSWNGNRCPEQQTARIFFTGCAAKATSHPTKTPGQYSPSPRDPEPISSSEPPVASTDLNARRIGKNREARLSNAEYPPRVPRPWNNAFQFAPVVVVKEIAQENGGRIQQPKGDSHAA